VGRTRRQGGAARVAFGIVDHQCRRLRHDLATQRVLARHQALDRLHLPVRAGHALADAVLRIDQRHHRQRHREDVGRVLGGAVQRRPQHRVQRAAVVQRLRSPGVGLGCRRPRGVRPVRRSQRFGLGQAAMISASSVFRSLI
jgi:hypothetical protein